jgi:hypothetical protein
MRRLAGLFVVLALAAAAVPLAAQSLTGTVSGTVSDSQGAVLPGATVTLVGKTGSRTAVTDASGEYRFVALDPGTYDVQVALSGFNGRKQENIAVSIAKDSKVDFTLSVGGLTDTIEVVGEAPVVDTSSSATDANLTQDTLFLLPIRPNNAATDMMNFLPGVNAGSAYGGDADTANGLLLDGVDTRDPEGGSAWTFFNFNILQEVQVSGVGAPAEFGAFTGAVVNSVTKSGGNRFAGLFEALYTSDSFGSDNITDEIVRQNASLASPAKVTKLLDITGQFSGPLVKDKLFFFASAQRYKRTTDPAGPVTVRDEVSPRFNAKLTYQPDANDTFTGTFQADDYNIIGRVPAAFTFVATDDITNREDAPELVWGVQWRHLFGGSTFSEIKYAGWSGYFDLNPEVNLPGHVDVSGQPTVSQGWFFYADRGRHQVNATLSHYAEAFGKHDLKFGVEVERSKVRNRYGYVNDIQYYDYAAYYPTGQYYAYSYGYDLDGRNQRESFFAQDSWKPTSRLTINAGARLDLVRGKATVSGEELYNTKNLAPRIGFAYDLTGDGRTVLKGHYGQYYEGAFFLTFSAATGGIGDFVFYAFDPSGEKCGPAGNCFTEISRSSSTLARVDPDIKHPRVDELTFGFERALTRDLRFSLTGIQREDKNLQGSLNPSARWARISLANGLAGGTVPAYTWVNPDESETDIVITNPDGFAYLDAAGNVLGRARAERKYKGLIFELDKRFSNRWQARLSYVLSKSEGSQDNDGFSSYGKNTLYESASRALVNRYGRLTNDRTHEFKLLASYQIPVIEVTVGAFFQAVSGRTYTPFQQFGSRDVNFPLSAGRRVLLEPLGSRREPTRKLLNLRFEKSFNAAGSNRFGVFADITNVTNSSVITDIQDRYPSVSITGVGAVNFGAARAVTAPRQITLGGRWSF